MNRPLLTLTVLLLSAAGSLLQAQTGGINAYSFLDIPPSARITALGGAHISVMDDDPAFAVLNPGVLNPAMHQSMTFQNNFYFDGIYNGYASYAHYFENSEITGHAGIQFMQYGKFTRADEFGNTAGEFKASDMALTVGAGKAFGERFSAGLNMRFIYSRYDSYNALAVAADIGGGYWDPEKNIGVGFVVRNVGFQLSKFDENAEAPPLDIQLGFSKRLKHLPFRLTITAHSLNRWNLRYDSPLEEQQTSLIGEESSGKSDFSKGVDNFFRHLVFSGEFLLGKTEAVRLRFGYNHQRRKELTVGSLRSLAGFSFGAGVRIKQFMVDYGFASYHIAGGTHHIGIATNLSRFKPDKGLLD